MSALDTVENGYFVLMLTLDQGFTRTAFQAGGLRVIPDWIDCPRRA